MVARKGRLYGDTDDDNDVAVLDERTSVSTKIPFVPLAFIHGRRIALERAVLPKDVRAERGDNKRNANANIKQIYITRFLSF